MPDHEKIEEDKTVGNIMKIPCLNCDVETSHVVLKSVSTMIYEEEIGVCWYDVYEIIKCQGCEVVSFRKISTSDDDIIGQDDGNWIYDEKVHLFPSRAEGRKRLGNYWDLPPHVRKVYEETHDAFLNKQTILTRIGIRVLVEAICKDKLAVGDNLKDKISSLVKIGVLTQEGAEIIDKTRIHGNEAAHEISSIREKDLEILVEVVENLLKNTYVLPKKVAELEKKHSLRN